MPRALLCNHVIICSWEVHIQIFHTRGITFDVQLLFLFCIEFSLENQSSLRCNFNLNQHIIRCCLIADELCDQFIFALDFIVSKYIQTPSLWLRVITIILLHLQDNLNIRFDIRNNTQHSILSFIWYCYMIINTQRTVCITYWKRQGNLRMKLQQTQKGKC